MKNVIFLGRWEGKYCVFMTIYSCQFSRRKGLCVCDDWWKLELLQSYGTISPIVYPIVPTIRYQHLHHLAVAVSCCKMYGRNTALGVPVLVFVTY